jgi:RimJ/RimL family protein N-acetyltransferase
LAWLDEEPAGMAYLNKHNFNIDYGIHVKRDFWRKRIGTKILKEALRTSGELGAKHISVVCAEVAWKLIQRPQGLIVLQGKQPIPEV